MSTAYAQTKRVENLHLTRERDRRRGRELATFLLVGLPVACAFLAYAAGQLPAAIWMGKPWSIAAKEVLDGLIYGLVTAGTFGWLWPR